MPSDGRESDLRRVLYGMMGEPSVLGMRDYAFCFGRRGTGVAPARIGQEIRKEKDYYLCAARTTE